MRAHGDEYKTGAALTKPLKHRGSLLGRGRDCLMSVNGDTRAMHGNQFLKLLFNLKLFKFV